MQKLLRKSRKMPNECLLRLVEAGMGADDARALRRAAVHLIHGNLYRYAEPKTVIRRIIARYPGFTAEIQLASYSAAVPTGQHAAVVVYTGELPFNRRGIVVK